MSLNQFEYSEFFDFYVVDTLSEMINQLKLIKKSCRIISASKEYSIYFRVSWLEYSDDIISKIIIEGMCGRRVKTKVAFVTKDIFPVTLIVNKRW